MLEKIVNLTNPLCQERKVEGLEPSCSLHLIRISGLPRLDSDLLFKNIESRLFLRNEIRPLVMIKDIMYVSLTKTILRLKLVAFSSVS